MTGSADAATIRVRGLVQGVGFRPFVYRIATGLGLRGDVRNDSEGVLIHAAGTPAAIDRLIRALQHQAPPLARVTGIERLALKTTVADGDFRILDSAAGAPTAGVVPDAALCDECRAEIDDTTQRRHDHAFASCTHCGPRFSIVTAIPYDRPNTTMRDFAMCPDCAAEYRDPGDRRFHAQPIACPVCGPSLRLCDPNGAPITGDPLAEAVAMLRKGGIVGLKGIGGYQLACDATNEAAVSTLRRRKQRPTKPFALMAPDLACIAANADETALLRSAAAPIVLLRGACPVRLAPSVAPGQATLGWMLPTSPLHHLLLRDCGFPLVMTSGNRSGEPQATGDAEAIERLGGFVDLFLKHDRPIARRLDDSVASVVNGQVRLHRRARGYAPAPLPLPEGLGGAAPILALGGDLKAAICLSRGNEALLSHHLGDLEDALTSDEFEIAIDAYADLFGHKPAVLACDLHPGYHASRWGRKEAVRRGIKLIEVQHHHAHIAAVMAEHMWPVDRGPVVGIVLDGLGFGSDGTIWGGEVLLCHYNGFQRLAHLRPVPLPGGTQAVLQPWRNLVAHLDAAFGPSEADAHLPPGLVRTKRLAMLRQAVAAGLNAPLSSSCGRLFDAVATALGVAPERLTFEGEAAMALEALAAEAEPQTPYPFGVAGTEPQQIDPAPMWDALLADSANHVPPTVIAARFHAGVAAVYARVACAFAHRHGARGVAVGGGCFQNRLLTELVESRLRDSGLEVLVPSAVPANDGGLAFGQVAVAIAQLTSISTS